MPLPSAKSKSVWENRYVTPTIDELRAEFGKQLGSLVDHARERLRSIPGVTEELAWQGISWRWSMTYRHEADAVRPWAYLILQPNRPRIALPLRAEVLAHLPSKKLSKAARDALIHAPLVADVRWPQLEFQTKGQLDEVLALVELKCSLVAPAQV